VVAEAINAIVTKLENHMASLGNIILRAKEWISIIKNADVGMWLLLPQ